VGATKHLLDLERLLEAPLFLRHAKGMSLTATGEQLLPVTHDLPLAPIGVVVPEGAALATNKLAHFLMGRRDLP